MFVYDLCECVFVDRIYSANNLTGVELEQTALVLVCTTCNNFPSLCYGKVFHRLGNASLSLHSDYMLRLIRFRSSPKYVSKHGIFFTILGHPCKMSYKFPSSLHFYLIQSQ